MRAMYKKVRAILLLLLMSIGAWAQDIEIRDFKEDSNSLIARLNPEKDLAGDYCAVIRFSVRDTSFVIEPNMGIVKRITKPGEILLYVPTMTRRLTVRHEGMLPLRGYRIPVKLEPKRTYDAVLLAVGAFIPPRIVPEVSQPKDTIAAPPVVETNIPVVAPTPPQRIEQKAKKEVEKPQTSQSNTMQMYVGGGFEVVSMTGVSVLVGMKASHHVVELGAVIGLGKSDELFFYQSDGTFIVGRQYSPLRVQLKYGYAFDLTNTIELTPMIGGGLNVFSGTEENPNPDYQDYYKKASSFSLVPAVRLSYALSKNVRLHATPGFALGMYKSSNCKLIGENDSKFKSWTDGFSLNLGVNILF